jgi:hypothetical protein
MMQTGITTRYTDEAIKFIHESKEENKPFFLYLAHNMPHVPLHPSEQFKGKSKYGIYGDCVEEIDWNTGRILEALDKAGLDDNTLVIYASDNGPWLRPKLIESPELYNLQEDIKEEKDVSACYPDVVKELLSLADTARNELGEASMGGSGERFWEQLPLPGEAEQDDSWRSNVSKHNEKLEL